MKIVGLTGGIATGKSTVARLLVDDHGAAVIDADQVARQVVEPGTPGLAAIVAAFGPDVLDPDGRLDRRAMRRRISDDPDARRRLEAITHPAIYAAIAAELFRLGKAGVKVAFVDAALMVETGSYKQWPQVVVVSTTPDVQLARLVARDGMSEDEARKLIATQMPLAEKEKVATFVVRNEGSLGDLQREVARMWSALAL